MSDEPTVNLGRLPQLIAQASARHTALLERVDAIQQQAQAEGFVVYTTGGEPQGINFRVGVPPIAAFLPLEYDRQRQAWAWNGELDALVPAVRAAAAVVRALEESQRT